MMRRNDLTMVQSGKYMTRGQQGEAVTRLHRVIWDPEINGWRAATVEDEIGFTSWGAWDSDFGWRAPWTPELE